MISVNKLERRKIDIPLQFIPSPLKPGLHLHVREPFVFVQSAFPLQPPFNNVLHSSISVMEKKD